MAACLPVGLSVSPGVAGLHVRYVYVYLYYACMLHVNVDVCARACMCIYAGAS